MTSSKADIIADEVEVVYRLDPRTMGYNHLVILLGPPWDKENQRVCYHHTEDNGLLSRWQLVETVVKHIRQCRPSRVGFKVLGSDIMKYWSDQTLQDVLANKKSAKDLYIE